MIWIKVTDRFPNKEECDKNYGWFLVKRACLKRACLSRFDGHEEPMYENGWKFALDHDITHWMELPEIPHE